VQAGLARTGTVAAEVGLAEREVGGGTVPARDAVEVAEYAVVALIGDVQVPLASPGDPTGPDIRLGLDPPV